MHCFPSKSRRIFGEPQHFPIRYASGRRRTDCSFPKPHLADSGWLQFVRRHSHVWRRDRGFHSHGHCNRWRTHSFGVFLGDSGSRVSATTATLPPQVLSVSLWGSPRGIFKGSTFGEIDCAKDPYFLVDLGYVGRNLPKGSL